MIATPDVLSGIPALPVAVAKVLEETSREEPDARILTRAIETDAGLTAKMLSLVNSPYYGLTGTVTSLSQAVMIAGMRQVRNVALAVGALRAIPGIPPSVVNAFLDRAMVMGKTARAIGVKGGLAAPDADTAHVGGLLREVGVLVGLRLGVRNPDDAQIADFGRMVLEHWKLPSAIVAAVAESAGPFEGAASPAFAVHVAAMTIAGRPQEVAPEALAALGMAIEDLAFYDPLVK